MEAKLQAAPVKVFNRESRQIYIFEAANIDAGHFDAVMRAGSKWRTTADGTEMVSDLLLAELVSGEIAFGGDKAHLVARDKPAQSSKPAADGAVTFRDAMQFTFDFKRDVAAMAATFVNHVIPLWW